MVIVTGSAPGKEIDLTLPDLHPGDRTMLPDTEIESVAEVPSEEDDYIPELFERSPATESELESARRAAWPATDRLSPCYCHLLADGADHVKAEKSFEFGQKEFELLLAANRYAPKGHYDVVAFGLRGARLRGQEKYELVDRLPLEDVRPDHRNFRCVVGFFFRRLGKFSAYTGSTVPWHAYMTAGKLDFNLLPTGCYIYKKGSHRPKAAARWVVPALRLSDANLADSGQATVLRTRKDAIFDFADEWSLSSPSDNIHCAYSNHSFSSLGCQTIKGGMHDGLWADFQSTVKTLPSGARVDYVLLTGAECSIAASILKTGQAVDDKLLLHTLGRLRAGSEGVEVDRLQAALGIAQTGYFGAVTKKKLTDVQAQNGLPPDGIFGPALDARLGWKIFGPLSPETGADKPIVVASALEAQPTGTVPRDARAPSNPPIAPPAPAISIDMKALLRIAPRPNNDARRAAIWDRYAIALTGPDGAGVLADFGITEKPQRFIFLLANILHETGGLVVVRENMRYSAARLLQIFGRSHSANVTPGEAQQLADKPEAIAERVYGLGNPRKARSLGNTQPGDGWRYRGGGFMQTTGRSSYRVLGQRIGEDLEAQPELLENAVISLKAACAEWHRGGLNDYADQGSFRACCNGINAGNPKRTRDPIGFNDRLKYLKLSLDAFGLPPVKRAPGALETVDAASGDLQLGDIGDAVAKLQEDLNRLGYDAGEADGLFTTMTRDAVLLFQARNGLPTTGTADGRTLEALSSDDAVPMDGEIGGRGQTRVDTSRHNSTRTLGLVILLLAFVGLAATLGGLLGFVTGTVLNDLAPWLASAGWVLAMLAGVRLALRASP